MKLERMLICVIPLALALSIFGCAKPAETNPTPPPRKATVDKVRELVSEQLNVDINTIKPTSSLGELGADDLDLVELIMELEDTFAIRIPDEKLDIPIQSTGEATKAITMQRLADIVDELKSSKN